MFFDELPPAETTGYMIAGYVVVFLVMGIYLAGLWVRWRNLQQDLKILKEINEKGDK